ncbi:MAG: hypothetical protein AAGA35_02445 [Patescibacteria group bacterium]
MLVAGCQTDGEPTVNTSSTTTAEAPVPQPKPTLQTTSVQPETPVDIPESFTISGVFKSGESFTVTKNGDAAAYTDQKSWDGTNIVIDGDTFTMGLPGYEWNGKFWRGPADGNWPEVTVTVKNDGTCDVNWVGRRPGDQQTTSVSKTCTWS